MKKKLLVKNLISKDNSQFIKKYFWIKIVHNFSDNDFEHQNSNFIMFELKAWISHNFYSRASTTFRQLLPSLVPNAAWILKQQQKTSSRNIGPPDNFRCLMFFHSRKNSLHQNFHHISLTFSQHSSPIIIFFSSKFFFLSFLQNLKTLGIRQQPSGRWPLLALVIVATGGQQARVLGLFPHRMKKIFQPHSHARTIITIQTNQFAGFSIFHDTFFFFRTLHETETKL